MSETVIGVVKNETRQVIQVPPGYQKEDHTLSVGFAEVKVEDQIEWEAEP